MQQGKNVIIEERALVLTLSCVCARVGMCVWCVLRWPVGYSLCCVSLHQQSLCYHNTECRQLLCASSLPYLLPRGACIGYCTPQGQYRGSSTRTQLK